MGAYVMSLLTAIEERGTVKPQQPTLRWQAELLRLTAFPFDASNDDGRAWWDEVIGDDPEQITSRPKIGKHSYQGALPGDQVPGAVLRLNVDTDRVDWVLTQASPQDDDESPEALVTLGSFDDVKQAFTSKVVDWFGLESCPALKRVAFGAILLHPVADRVAGYKLFDGLLPIEMDPEGMSDFLYQINRSRLHRVDEGAEIRVNRLSKWSVRLLQGMEIKLSPTGGQVIPVDSHTLCRLELDVNTAPDYSDTITPKQARSLFETQVEFGTEIARKGDVR